MSKFQSKIFDNKIVIGVRDWVAEDVEELLQSEIFKELLNRFSTAWKRSSRPCWIFSDIIQ